MFGVVIYSMFHIFSTIKVEVWGDSAGNIPRRKQDKGYQKFLGGFVRNIEGNWRFSFLFVNPRLRSNFIQLLTFYNNNADYSILFLSKCINIYEYIWCTLVHVKFRFNFSLCGNMRD